MPRLLSLQVPESAPRCGDDIASEIEFVAVAGAGQGLIEAVAAVADGIGGAAPNSLGRAIVQRDGACAGPVPAMPANGADCAWLAEPDTAPRTA